MDLSGTQCARARESVSIGLDGELRELDFRRLQAHLRVCADCAAWSERVEVTTTQLREAPLAAPVAPIELPRRGRTWRAVPALSAAAGLAVVASIVVFLGGAQHGWRGVRPAPNPALRSQQRDIGHNGSAVGVYVPDAHRRAFHAV